MERLIGKRTLIGSLIMAAGLGYFLVSPFLGLMHLQSAIEARNAGALAERVDFRRVRQSLGHQIIATYLKISGRGSRLGQVGSTIAAGYGASIADPLLNDLINPETMLDFLAGRGVSSTTFSLPPGLGPLPTDALGSLWQAFTLCEYGIGNFYISLPVKVEATERFRLRMQVLQWDWKLTEIGLPERLRVMLAKELERRIGQANPPPRPLPADARYRLGSAQPRIGL
jgi:Protein of unknown function (DUF2939)